MSTRGQWLAERLRWIPRSALMTLGVAGAFLGRFLSLIGLAFAGGGLDEAFWEFVGMKSWATLKAFAGHLLGTWAVVTPVLYCLASSVLPVRIHRFKPLLIYFLLVHFLSLPFAWFLFSKPTENVHGFMNYVRGFYGLLFFLWLVVLLETFLRCSRTAKFSQPSTDALHAH